MKKTVFGTVAAGMLAMGGMAGVAQAEGLSVAGDMGVYSQYMWRGMQQTQGASVQGDFAVDIAKGLSANVWFATPLGNNVNGGNKTEFDWTVDYSGEVNNFSYSVGGIFYSYLNNGAGNAGEIYAGVGYGPVSITYYYALAGSWKKDAYIDAALSQSVGGFDLGADFGFYLPSTAAANPTGFPTTKKSLGHVDLSVSKDVSLADGVTMTPSLMISTPMYSGKPKNANQVVAGINFSY